MKKTLRSFMACVTAAALLCSTAVVSASAAQAVEPSAVQVAAEKSGEYSVYGDFEYDKYSSSRPDTAEIKKYHGTAAEVEIPAEIDGLTVVSIGYEAFKDCTSIEKLTLPDSLEKIDMGAFKGCTGIKSLALPDSLRGISSDSFEGCTSLTEFSVSDSNTNYSVIDGALYNYTGSDIKICPPGKESITLGEKVRSVDLSSFNGCTKLKTVNIPATVTSVNSSAFKDCYSLESITVDEKNKDYCSEDGVLYNKKKTRLVSFPGSRKTFTFPETVEEMSSSCFEGCIYLESVKFSKKITDISYCAFKGCTSLKNMVVPDTIRSLMIMLLKAVLHLRALRCRIL